MAEPTITCPKCKTEIKLTESLAAPLIESTRRQFEQQLAQKDSDIAAREQAMREKEKQLADAKNKLDERLLSHAATTVPAATSWYLADVGEARGQQELFTRQAPQRLKKLREHALIESAVSSNRIEGVTVEPGRVRELILGQPLLRDRDEEEVRGYRDALTLIHENPAALPVSDATIQKLHALSRGEIWDAGKYKDKDGDIIECYPDGSERVRFRTVSAAETPASMVELVVDWKRCLDERWIHPLIALARL